MGSCINSASCVLPQLKNLSVDSTSDHVQELLENHGVQVRSVHLEKGPGKSSTAYVRLVAPQLEQRDDESYPGMLFPFSRIYLFTAGKAIVSASKRSTVANGFWICSFFRALEGSCTSRRLKFLFMRAIFVENEYVLLMAFKFSQIRIFFEDSVSADFPLLPDLDFSPCSLF